MSCSGSRALAKRCTRLASIIQGCPAGITSSSGLHPEKYSINIATTRSSDRQNFVIFSQYFRDLHENYSAKHLFSCLSQSRYIRLIAEGFGFASCFPGRCPISLSFGGSSSGHPGLDGPMAYRYLNGGAGAKILYERVFRPSKKAGTHSRLPAYPFLSFFSASVLNRQDIHKSGHIKDLFDRIADLADHHRSLLIHDLLGRQKNTQSGR